MGIPGGQIEKNKPTTGRQLNGQLQDMEMNPFGQMRREGMWQNELEVSGIRHKLLMMLE